MADIIGKKIVSIIQRFKTKWWGMLLLSAIPFFIVLSPILIGGMIFSNGDILTSGYQIDFFYKYSLQNHDSILWNPNNFSGYPIFIIAMLYFSPVFYLFFKIFSVFTAFSWLIFINLTLAAFFTAKLLEKFNLPFWPCLLGGMTYVFSQWSWASDLTVANGLPLLPLLFLIVWQTKERKNFWWVALGGLAIGYGWLSVHFNWVPMIIIAGFSFSIFLGWQDNKKFLLPLKFLLMVAIGTLIGLITLIPALVYLFLSVRAGGLSYTQAAGVPLGFGDLIHYFLPYFQIPYFQWASETQIYLGVLPLFFLLLGLSFKTSLQKFFSAVFLFCFILAIQYSPLFWLWQKIPGLNYLRSPSRWLFVGFFAAAILAAFGLNNFFSADKEFRVKLLLKIFKYIGALILLVFLLVNSIFLFYGSHLYELSINYFDQYIYPKTSQLPVGYYHQVISRYLTGLEKQFSLLNYQMFLPLIFIFVGCFIIAYFCKRKDKFVYFYPVAFFAALLNFLLIFIFYFPIFPKKLFDYQPATVNFIKSQPAGRIFSFLPGFTEYNKLTVPYNPAPADSFIFQSEFLTPDLNQLYRLEAIDNYNPIMPRRMARILAALGSDRATVGEKLSNLKIPPEEKAQILASRKGLLDLLGVRYIISAIFLPQDKFNKVFETKVSPYGIPIAVYENKTAKQLIYFIKKIETIFPDENNALEKLMAGLDGGENYFIECSQCPETRLFDGQASISVVDQKNDFITLATDSKSNQFLVFSQNNLPGWRAYIDDKITDIYTVNSVYMGIIVPAGQHQVYFKFKYWSIIDIFLNDILSKFI